MNFSLTKNMYLCLIGLLLITCVPESQSLRLAPESTGRIQRYLDLLQKYFAKPRHPATSEEDWLFARTGITEEFESILDGLTSVQLEHQSFTSVVYSDRDSVIPVEGENIIAVFRGRAWGSKDDEILVIGSHYDTDAITLGIDDNGSGVVAMLEVARMLAEDLALKEITLNHTVIFVAFDIQRHEHGLTWFEEEGTGSHFFVREKLHSILYQEVQPKFKGAIILDAILNYVDTPNAQVLPDDFAQTFPVANDHVVNNQFKGDFIGLVNQDGRYNSSNLTNAIFSAWKTVPYSPHYPLINMEVKATKFTVALYEFLRQDHLAFWNNMVGETPQPLPAILLTDTGKWRQMPAECPEPCQVASILDESKLDLMDQVVHTLYRTVTSLQTEARPRGNGSAERQATTLSVVLSILIAALCSHK